MSTSTMASFPVADFERRYTKKRLDLGKLMADPESYIGKTVTVCGWATQVRDQKHNAFIKVNDGSNFEGLQSVVDKATASPEVNAALEKVSKDCSVKIVGEIVKSPSKGQAVDIQVQELLVYGENDATAYPLQGHGMTRDTLRGPNYCHLRCRTKTFRAVFGIRNTLAAATHEFFQSHGMKYVHTPILTANDCEGAGEQFLVTNMMCDGNRSSIPTVVPAEPEGAEPTDKIDFAKDFFGKEVSLTVSGQLHVEAFSSAVSDVYTFGPTFRAEHSHTSRHLAEFWMIEPEISFAGMEEDINLAEDYLKYCVAAVLARHKTELQFLTTLSDNSKDLINRLETILKTPFKRISYTEAVETLEKQIAEVPIRICPDNWGEMTPKEQKKWKKSKRVKDEKTQMFEKGVTWGDDLRSEHEKYLTDVMFKGPVVVYNYPMAIKSFYMKANVGEEAGRETVQALDILVPGIGEIIGGSAREDDYEKLKARVEKKGIALESMKWYMDLRKYGSVPHAGFGLGFERLVMLCTAMENIKDTIPFPRSYGDGCSY